MRWFPRSPFFYALLPSLLFYTVILSRNWIPIHDTFQTMNIAYFLFNEAVAHHAIPLWYPHINYGVDTNWYLVTTLGPSLATMLGLARLVGRGNLLQYYYFAMFLDEFVLLVGTYLLARTLFRKPLTIVFVCIAMTGSLLWFAQPWFNLHLYYFVPLSMYFVMTGFARMELWRALAGGLVLLISEFGGLYFAMIHALTYAVIVAGAWWAYRFDLRSAWRRVGAREWAVLGACILAATTLLLVLTHGVTHVIYDVGRVGSRTTAESFLTYGGDIGLSKFAELVTGVSWDIDANAYAGVLVFGSVVFGLLWAPERRMVPLLGTVVVLVLLSIGKESFVAPLLYEVPGMAYFRHIGLVVPLIRVMLVVLSGFGFEALLHVGESIDKNRWHRARRAHRIMAVILAMMSVLALVLVGLGAIGLISGHEYVFAAASDATNRFVRMQTLLSRAAFVEMIYAAALGVLVAALLHRRRTVPTVAILLLLIQAVDVYSYRMSEFQTHMVPIDATYRGLFAFTDRPFVMERVRDPMTSASFRVVASRFDKRIERGWYDQCTKIESRHCYYDFQDTANGVLYNTIEPFVNLDPCRSIFRMDYWLPGVDTFYRAITSMPLHNLDIMPGGYEGRRIYFPVGDERVDKITGCQFPKLQLFSSVTVMGDDDLAALMRNPEYTGDLLLASEADYREYLTKRRGAGLSLTGGPMAEVRPSANTRVQGTVRVLSATANTLTVRVVPTKVAGGEWLYYADAWHRFWHAQVNGVEVPILRANFGFKAINLPGDVATVKFAYRSGTLSAALAVAQVLLISATLAVLYVGIREWLRPSL